MKQYAKLFLGIGAGLLLAGCSVNGHRANECIDIGKMGPDEKRAFHNAWVQRIQKISKANFFYPSDAFENQLEGTVVINLIVTKFGDIEKVTVSESSGHKTLDNAALKLGKEIESALSKSPVMENGGCFAEAFILKLPIFYHLSPANTD